MAEMQKTLITKEGLEKMQKELEDLRTTKRAEVAQRLKEAIAMGDLSENSEYDEAKNAQAFLEGRIVQLEQQIRTAQIDPGNIGTIIRTAAAAEVKGILLTKGCTDAYSDKAVRSSMGSILRIPVYENISLEFLQDLKKSGISFIGTALKNALPYKEANVPEDCIFVFGNEGNGISPEILAMTDFNVYIPIAGVESLNVAIASAIILFHFKD